MIGHPSFLPLLVPWHSRIHPILVYVKKNLTLEHKEKQCHAQIDTNKLKVTLVTHNIVRKVMKKSILSYLIFSRERQVSLQKKLPSSLEQRC